MTFQAANMAPQGDMQWFSTVQAAFPDQELCRRIYSEASLQPQRLPGLFEDISRYVLSLKTQQPQSAQELPTNQKKRKLEDGTAQPQTNGAVGGGITNASVAFECKDVSVQIPARKKLRVQIVEDTADTSKCELRLLNPTNDVEYSIPAESIDQVLCLPVPDKQQRQSHFAVFPKPGALDSKGAVAEQVLFTLNETSPPASAASTKDPVATEDTYVTVTHRAFTRMLQPYGKQVIVPTASEFASARPQSHRRGEKAYHVNAYRGSKEGYLFFLPHGILFGFKKPMVFYPFSAIESISYTSVLQRTFNLVVAATEGISSDGSALDVKETEFSMLDQEDFAGIDEYVKRHGLNDASLAAGRRAKEYGVNKEKKAEATNGDVAAAGAGGEVGEDGLTELQRAEQQLQDEEDEEEEDYEASGGESDGEGEESDEDDEEGYEYEEGDDEGEENAEDVEYDEEE